MDSWKWKALYKYEQGGHFWFLINCFFFMAAMQTYVFENGKPYGLWFWSMAFVLQAFLIYTFRTNRTYQVYKRLQGLELTRNDTELIKVLERYQKRLSQLDKSQRSKELETMKFVDPAFEKYPELYNLLKKSVDLL